MLPGSGTPSISGGAAPDLREPRLPPGLPGPSAGLAWAPRLGGGFTRNLGTGLLLIS